MQETNKMTLFGQLGLRLPLAFFILLSAEYPARSTEIPANWTATERFVWQELNASGRATLAQEDRISSEFLIRILMDSKFSSGLKEKGVSIINGRITGRLSLTRSKIDIPVLQLSMEFLDAVDISDSTFTGSVSFRAAHLLGGLVASRSIISGSLLLGDSDDDVYDGKRKSGGSLISSLIAPHLRLNGDLVLSGATISKPVDLSYADMELTPLNRTRGGLGHDVLPR